MSKPEFDNISFDLPKNQSNVIKVIGVGGGGSNAINHMFRQGIKGVDFVICNTDSQALENSPVPIKIQLGVSLTEGLGAGANPDVGKEAALESMNDIKSMLSTNTKMIFITAGMGGGTGTGAAPIIAKMAKELDVLTVGIVTIPFQFEGKTRNQQAQIGVENLRKNVDSLIVINNNKLREVYGNLGFKAGFSKADEVLATASRGIAEVITHHYTQNIDLRDAKTVLANSGTAIMGSGIASGEERAREAIVKALDSPLLNDNKITGAKNVLLLIVSGSEEITLDEIGEISDHIQEEAGHSANIIMGVGEDENLEKAIAVTVIATGFDADQQNEIVNTEAKRIIHTLEDDQPAEQVFRSNRPGNDNSFSKKATPQTEESVVRHNLFEEEATTKPTEELPFEGYIPTSELLKNLPVTYDEVFPRPESINDFDVNDFIIVDAQEEETPLKNKASEQKEDLPTANPVKEESQMLMFDLPQASEDELSSEKKTPRAAKDIEVNRPVEIVPVDEVTKDGVKRYTLEDYDEVTENLSRAKAPATDKKEAPEDPELAFQKTDTPAQNQDSNAEGDIIDPMTSSIADLLKKRTEERKAKMKAYNHKFNSQARIDELEKQPAYKRQGIDLDDENAPQSNVSRTTLSLGDDDDLELRNNNSFLHDNVD